MGRTIITCALTGGGALGRTSGAVPVTPAHIAADAIGAARAGAAIVHIHVRDPQTGAPSMELACYREVVERIRTSGVDVVLNLTTGIGARFIPGEPDPLVPAAGSTLTTPEARIRHVLDLRPEICTLDVATMNFGSHVIINTPAHLSRMAALAREAGAKPELEVFDLGGIDFARRMIAKGEIDAPAMFQLCLGIPGGAPATPDVMLAMRRELPADALWSGFGIAAASFPMLAQAFMLGGHVRVGLEDNLYLEKGVLAPDNAALVEKAVAIIRSLGGTPATPDEARALLGLRKQEEAAA